MTGAHTNAANAPPALHHQPAFLSLAACTATGHYERDGEFKVGGRRARFSQQGVIVPRAV